MRDFDSRTERLRGIMAPVISPDGTQVAFAALGDLWLMPIGVGPKRLTNDRFVEMHPTWSPDGRSSPLVRSRRDDGSLGTRSRQRRRPQGGVGGNQGGVGAARHRDRLSSREGAIAITGRSAPIHPPIRDPGRPTWAPEGLIAITTLQPFQPLP